MDGHAQGDKEQGIDVRKKIDRQKLIVLRENGKQILQIIQQGPVTEDIALSVMKEIAEEYCKDRVKKKELKQDRNERLTKLCGDGG